MRDSGPALRLEQMAQENRRHVLDGDFLAEQARFGKDAAGEMGLEGLDEAFVGLRFNRPLQRLRSVDVAKNLAKSLAEPRPLFGVAAPLYCPSGVAAFGRHPTTSKLVWSSIIGYPADFNYREYYRDIGFELDPEYLSEFQYAEGIRTHTGIKYHRITGPGEHKLLYNPDWASDTARKHATSIRRPGKAYQAHPR